MNECKKLLDKQIEIFDLIIQNPSAFTPHLVKVVRGTKTVILLSNVEPDARLLGPIATFNAGITEVEIKDAEVKKRMGTLLKESLILWGECWAHKF